MTGLLIGTVAKRAGVSPPAIRYYEQIGVLAPALRSSTGYRRYSDATVEELRFVRKAQALGFSLDEIATILRLSRSGKAPCSQVLAVAHRHLAAVEDRIRHLQKFRERLAAELTKWDGKQMPTCQGLCQIIVEAEAADPAEDVDVQAHLSRSRRGRARARRLISLLLTTAIFAWRSPPAHAGPITFLTALPVAQSQVVVRGQYVFIRAREDPTPAQRNLTVKAVPVAVAVGATPRLALFGVVPIVDKSIDMSTPAGRVTRSATGLGDIVAFARYTVYARDLAESTFRIAPFGGFKMPTGESAASDSLGRLPAPLQPGSGSWDGLGGLAVTLQTKQWELDLDAGYKKNTEADGFRFGDELFSDLSFQYRVWPTQLGPGVPAFLFAIVETNLIMQGRHETGDARDPSSGGTRWDLDLGLQYVTTDYIVETVVQIPAVDAPNGTGLRSDFRVTAGVRWNVALPF